MMPPPPTDHDNPTAVSAICRAIATPIEVKNKGGVLRR